MSSIKAKIAGKAAKSTAKHTARGTASKLKRDPMRSGTMLLIGCAAGLLIGWLIARPGMPIARPGTPAGADG
jgi:F0F1-type ATP synthase assembly protein I